MEMDGAYLLRFPSCLDFSHAWICPPFFAARGRWRFSACGDSISYWHSRTAISNWLGLRAVISCFLLFQFFLGSAYLHFMAAVASIRRSWNVQPFERQAYRRFSWCSNAASHSHEFLCHIFLNLFFSINVHFLNQGYVTWFNMSLRCPKSSLSISARG